MTLEERTMRVRLVPPLTLGVAILLMAGAAAAHHSFAGVFDGSRALHLHGVVASVELANPHSYIYLHVRTGEGAVERWALEGPSTLALRRRGLEQVVKAGDTLGVCGYAARHDVPTSGTQPVTGASRKLSAAVLTLPGGETLLWENYRQGKCGLDHGPEQAFPQPGAARSIQ
jgi:hypothetical protein